MKQLGRMFWLGMALVLACGVSAQTAKAPATQAARDYTIDVANSQITFFVGSSLGDVEGKFSQWTGTMKVGKPGVPETAKVTLVVQTKSMSSGSGIKDRTMKGKKFFDVENYPTITFTSTKVTAGAGTNQYVAAGDFTLRGVTRPVTMQVTLDRDGKGNGQIFADLAFDRRDFGMTESVPLVRVSDSVRVKMDIAFTSKPRK